MVTRIKVKFHKTLQGEEGVRFEREALYNALDGDSTVLEELAGKVLVARPDSPKGETWYCPFEKEVFESGLGQIIE